MQTILQVPDSILLVDKKASVSSFDIIRKIKRAFSPSLTNGVKLIKKIGHAGTLDPIATGLVIILLNGATKKSQNFLNMSKVYDAGIFIGAATDSYDATGQVTARTALPAGYFDSDEAAARLEDSINFFSGEIMQEPPMFSALKKNGQTLYKLARAGITVEREKRQCTIYSIEPSIEKPLYDSAREGFTFNFRVSCSKGTYIRSLCHDIGAKLGIPCCMDSLRRIETGGYSVKDAVAFEEITMESVMGKVIAI